MRTQARVVHRRPEQIQVGDEVLIAGNWQIVTSVARDMRSAMELLAHVKETDPSSDTSLGDDAFDEDGQMVATLFSTTVDHGDHVHEGAVCLTPGFAIMSMSSGQDNRFIPMASYRPQDVMIGDEVVNNGMVHAVFAVANTAAEVVSTFTSMALGGDDAAAMLDLSEFTANMTAVVPTHLFMRDKDGDVSVLVMAAGGVVDVIA